MVKRSDKILNYINRWQDSRIKYLILVKICYIIGSVWERLINYLEQYPVPDDSLPLIINHVTHTSKFGEQQSSQEFHKDSESH